MAGKCCLVRDSDRAVSQTSKVRPVRVVHISNPTKVKASVSEFRSVVQSLTGQKRYLASVPTTAQFSPTSSYASELLSADDGSPALKAAKLEDAAGLECSWSRMNSVASDILNVCSNSSSSSSSNTELGDRDDGERQRSEKRGVSAIEIHDIPSQQMFESLDCIGDNKFLGLEFLSPSFMSSDLDNLYVNLLM